MSIGGAAIGPHMRTTWREAAAVEPVADARHVAFDAGLARIAIAHPRHAGQQRLG